MLTIKDKDGKEYKLSEDELEKVVKETIQEYQEYLTSQYRNDSFCPCDAKTVLVEGLIKTSSPKEAMRMIARLVKSVNGDTYGIGGRIMTNRIGQAQIYISFGKGLSVCGASFLKELLHKMEVYGWYFGKVHNTTMNQIDDGTLYILGKMKSFTLIFEPKFDMVIDFDKLPKTLYHLTAKKYLPKIMKQGLTPKNHGKNNWHPERVYLFWQYPNNWHNIEEYFNYMEKQDDEYCILSIDTKFLNDTNTFYIDQNSKDYPAIFTNEPIPPFAIKAIEDGTK